MPAQEHHRYTSPPRRLILQWIGIIVAYAELRGLDMPLELPCLGVEFRVTGGTVLYKLRSGSASAGLAGAALLVILASCQSHNSPLLQKLTVPISDSPTTRLKHLCGGLTRTPLKALRLGC